MQLSQNKARLVDRSPWLTQCFDTYFSPGKFVFDRSHLVDVKFRPDGYYAVMLFEVDGVFYGADAAGADTPAENGMEYLGLKYSLYTVCNDCIDFDEETWKTVKVDPYCDGFTTAEDRE